MGPTLPWPEMLERLVPRGKELTFSRNEEAFSSKLTILKVLIHLKLFNLPIIMQNVIYLIQVSIGLY